MLIFILAATQEWMDGGDVQNVDTLHKRFSCAYIFLSVLVMDHEVDAWHAVNLKSVDTRR